MIIVVDDGKLVIETLGDTLEACVLFRVENYESRRARLKLCSANEVSSGVWARCNGKAKHYDGKTSAHGNTRSSSPRHEHTKTSLRKQQQLRKNTGAQI